jgi:hypothetical protein
MLPICCSTVAEPSVEPALAYYWRIESLETSRFYCTSPRFTCKDQGNESGRCWDRTSVLCRVKELR